MVDSWDVESDKIAPTTNNEKKKKQEDDRLHSRLPEMVFECGKDSMRPRLSSMRWKRSGSSRSKKSNSNSYRWLASKPNLIIVINKLVRSCTTEMWNKIVE